MLLTRFRGPLKLNLDTKTASSSSYERKLALYQISRANVTLLKRQSKLMVIFIDRWKVEICRCAVATMKSKGERRWLGTYLS